MERHDLSSSKVDCPMIYGPHTNDVMDVLDFLKSGRLLRSSRPPLSPDLKIIHDEGEIERYREIQDDSPDDWWCWHDIMERLGENDWELACEELGRLSVSVNEALTKLWDGEVYGLLKGHLAHRFGEQLIENMWADFTYITSARAAFGRSAPFVERLVGFYRLGGFPCGWDGVHPQGRLVVFFPQRETNMGEEGESTEHGPLLISSPEHSKETLTD